MPTRRTILPLLAVAASAAAALPIIGFGAPNSGMPDLRSDPPRNAYLEANGGRLLLRFDGYVTNVGTGPLDITGDPSVGGGMKQRTWDGSTWTEVGAPRVTYETADGHDHFHLMNAMYYSLVRADSTVEVAPGQKVGFCLYDIEWTPSSAPVRDEQAYSPQAFCQQGKPWATELSMGVSAGWRDVYDAGLTFQWVDVSRTAPGPYRLSAVSDPNNVIRESNEGNNGSAYTAFTIPGHVAQPVGPVQVPGGSSARPITLAALTHGGGAAGARRFRVASAPAHGTLNVAVGQEITGGQVLYTPDPRYSGPDSFTFTAHSGSGEVAGFPRNPATAPVTIQVGQRTAPTLQISGAPASMVAGTSVQLGAVLSPAGAVTWSASAGAISPGGLYVAPATPPAGGTATIRATSADDPSVSAQVQIAIAPVPPKVGAPGLPTGGAAVAGGNGLLVRPSVTRRGRIIAVRTTARVDGRLVVSAIRNGRAVARCRVGARAGRRVACKLVLPRRLARSTVRVAVGLKGTGGRRASVRLLARPRA
ncbi:lysyl oxidase family protein [Miltoncostaea marina]|uniref:lysyl oxidase family protein n=1 Tax=Miltoncostaea marina TaxID=2843215 RepID=UPI001C3E17A5|nr:lysyl oxidase family protein [Miltoncostaea marina]